MNGFKYLLLNLFAFILVGGAQSGLAQEASFLLFQDISQKTSIESHQKYIVNQKYLEISVKAVKAIQKAKPNSLTLKLPSSVEIGELELKRTNVFAGGYILRDENGRSLKTDNEYAFYRGQVKNDPNSSVVVTFVNDKVQMMIAKNRETFRIHKLKDQPYVFFKDSDMKQVEEYECGTLDDGKTIEFDQALTNKKNRSFTGNCVEMFFDCDHDTYLKNGSSIANTEAWIASIFNEVQTLYANENIPVSISDVRVWTQPDPWAGLTGTLSILNDWGPDVVGEGFNGRLAHFVSTRGIGGGIAWVNVLCSNNNNTAVSGSMSTNVVPFPNYSWNVNVVAHEMGHNFGSSHTHSCVWNGNGTQIDDCGATYTNPTPSCYDAANPIIPPKGTIMSYCHLGAGNGMDFNLGFGDQPGALIFSRYQNASCNTGNCSAPSCVALVSPNPGNDMETINVNVSWASDLGAEGYRVTMGTSPTNGSITNNTDVGLTTTFDPGTLQYGTTYYVKIVPYNELGNASGCTNYSFSTEPNNPPSCVQVSSPPNGSIEVNTDVLIQWPEAPGNQLGYKIRIGTTPGGNQVLDNLDVGNVNQYQSANLSTLTTYYVVIIPYGTNGDLTGCTSTSFRTNNILQYCSSQGNSTNDEWINSLTIGNLQNTSGNNGGYEDFTNLTFDASAGQTYGVSITPAYSGQLYNEVFRIWIDFNRDGDFTDAGEQLFSVGPANETVTGSISIPQNAMLGTTRMRVTMRYNTSPSSCGNFNYGEVEDYAVVIGSGVPCNMVTNANESGPGSFMEALGCINEGDTIQFDNSLSGQTIEFTSTFAVINQDVVIKVNEGIDITICGTSTPTVFSVQPGSLLHIIGMEILSGTNIEGGGITNNGTLILENSSVKPGPGASSNASLISNNGSLEIKGSTIILEN